MHDVAGKTLIVLLSGGLDSMVCAGLAREAGALYGLAPCRPAVSTAAITSAKTLAVAVENAVDCPRYAGRVIERINADDLARDDRLQDISKMSDLQRKKQEREAAIQARKEEEERIRELHESKVRSQREFLQRAMSAQRQQHDEERKQKLNPNDKADAAAYTLDKQYTNIEVYLNSLVSKHTL